MQHGHRILHGTGCERTRNEQHLIEVNVKASKAWCAMCATEFNWETILEEILGRIALLEDEVKRLREENFNLDKESSWDKHVVIPDLERQISELEGEGTPLARLTYLSNEAVRLGIITPHSSTPPERRIIAAIESLQRQVALLAKEAGYRTTG